MSDLHDYNRETKEDRAARRARAQLLTAGVRGGDYLTDLERALLMKLREMGLDIRRGWIVNERTGQHCRAVQDALTQGSRRIKR